MGDGKAPEPPPGSIQHLWALLLNFFLVPPRLLLERVGFLDTEEQRDEKRKKKEEEIEKKRTPVRTDRVRPGFTNAEVDQWIEEDKLLPENQPYVSGKFIRGDKVQLQETGMEFVIHDFTHQGIVLQHAGGAFKNGAKDDDLVRAGTWVEKAVHHGVGCDRSGMAPIIGTRYNKGEEDLCEAEYNKMTDEEKVGWTAIPFPPEKGKQQNGHENGSTEKHENGGFFGW